VDAVAYYCDPETYPSSRDIHDLTRSGVKVTIGIHPSHARKMRKGHWELFRELTSHPDVAGIGEIGYDHQHTGRAEDMYRQQDVVDQALSCLREDHVLVIHTRSASRDSMGAYQSLLYQLHALIPSTQRIHLHCFTGDRRVMQQWIDKFPGIKFGYTRAVRDFNEDQLAAVKEMDEDRLMLETDAPYFHFHGFRNSTPSFIGMVAELVAKIRCVDIRRILRVTTANARNLYQ
jgi:TatD DNase family protein